LVPAEVCVEDSHLKAGAKIYEDSILQVHYNSVLTILTMNEPLTEESSPNEEQALEEIDSNEFTIYRHKWPGRR
jgi:hypothetical protein